MRHSQGQPALTTPHTLHAPTGLLVVFGFVLSLLAGLVAAVLLKLARATLVQAMCGGGASFVAVMTLYLATVVFLHSGGGTTSG